MRHILFIVSTFFATIAFSHGEDKFGPNGGFVRMPGAYHTEVVIDGKTQLKVYLLDIHWKNPTTKNSSVEISFPGKSKKPVQCQPKEEYFACDVPAKINLQKKGDLVVNSQREGQKGNQASYALPLKLEKSDDGHSEHH